MGLGLRPATMARLVGLLGGTDRREGHVACREEGFSALGQQLRCASDAIGVVQGASAGFASVEADQVHVRIGLLLALTLTLTLTLTLAP